MILLIIFILTSTLVVLILTCLKFFISDTLSSSREESTSYECGFEHHSLSRVPISIRYFMLTVVFLIFDLEIILLIFIPYDTTIGINPLYTTEISLLFITLLFLGLVFEWADGSLD